MARRPLDAATLADRETSVFNIIESAGGPIGMKDIIDASDLPASVVRLTTARLVNTGRAFAAGARRSRRYAATAEQVRQSL